METSGRNLVDHWAWAAEKGLMNPNTANALRAACSTVLGVLEDWESLDVRELDLDAALNRFENLRKQHLNPQTLETYKGRFKRAVDSFLSYHEAPSSWRPLSQERSEKSEQNWGTKRPSEDDQQGSFSEQGQSVKLVAYPYPLRSDMIVRLILPRDLNVAEVKRLTKFLESLAVDAPEGD